MNSSKFICVILAIGYLSSSLIAQKQISKAEALGNEFINKGYSFFENLEIDSALFYCNKATLKYKEAQNWAYYIHVLTDISQILYKDQRILDFNQSVIFAYQEAKSYLPQDDPLYGRVFNNLDVYYYAVGNYEKSIEFAEQALNIEIEHKASTKEIAKYYMNIGNAAKFTGDYDLAFSYLRKALQIRKANNVSNRLIAITLEDIGRVFEIKNQLDSAIYYFESAELILASSKKSKAITLKKADNYLDLAGLWNQKKELEKTKFYLNKVSDIPLNEFLKIKLAETRGKYYLATAQNKKAISAFKNAQHLSHKYAKRNTPPYQARRFILLGKAFEAIEKPDSALSVYQQGLDILTPYVNLENIFSNPEINQLLDKPDALKLLKQKAQLLSQFYTKNQNIEYLLAAHDTYSFGTYLIKDIRNEILSLESKKVLSENSTAIFEGAIWSAFELYNHTQEPKYKAIALNYAEANKAQLLLESINEQSAKIFAGIPDSILNQEKDIKLRIAYLKKTLLNQKLDNVDIKKTQNELFELTQSKKDFIRNLEKNYPKYFNLKYQNDPAKLEDIYKYLSTQNLAIFDFFVGNDNIFLFTITSNEIQFQKIEHINTIEKEIEALKFLINHPPDKGFNIAALNEFSNIAYSLYSKLIKTACEQLPDRINNFLILPDYYINYIPFDILLKTQDSNGTFSPKMMDYLFEEYTISYDYSITLHLKNVNRESRKKEKGFIGFAPDFQEAGIASNRSCNIGELYALKCSKNEVQTIANIMNGKAVFGSDANKQNFESMIKDYEVIHLATHACIDEKNSNLNKIFLADDYLSDLDLYNMELNTNLAVLSACNTGSGELIKGEGVMSLARGFINAGCSSTVISMWSVDDCATSDIMQYFYQGLNQGLSKDHALKNAKIKYLKSSDKSKSHPYYWAAFVPFGDMSEINIRTSKNNWTYYLLISIVVLAGGLLFFKNRHNQTP